MAVMAPADVVFPRRKPSGHAKCALDAVPLAARRVATQIKVYSLADDFGNGLPARSGEATQRSQLLVSQLNLSADHDRMISESVYIMMTLLPKNKVKHSAKS